MTDLILLWEVLFVIGVWLMAISANGGPPYFSRFAWILWAVAALIWILAGHVGYGDAPLLGHHRPLL